MTKPLDSAQPLVKAEAVNLPTFEQQMIEVWREERTFEQSVSRRLEQQAPRFSFYDGPPFANGLPHYGHVVPVTIKDAVTRYKTMAGYYVPRRLGWDTHGLPVENEVEKQLGIKNKREILDYGVDKFIKASRNSVFTYRSEWEQFFERLGRWADKDNAYATLDRNYIESVWWVVKQLHNKELLYESFRSMPYCPRCATPLSNFEVNQNYKDNTPDPSVFVKFGVIGQPHTYLLAWTTTPWTLPANAALAVDKEAAYITVKLTNDCDGDGWLKGDKLVLAKQRLEVLGLRGAEYEVVEELKGADLVGWRYHPVFEQSLGQVDAEQKNAAWHVYHDDSVSLDDGTGVLHVAPRYGETDLTLGLREGLPLIESVDQFGVMRDWTDFGGQEFKEADNHIIAALTKEGSIFAAERFEHTYPFCWRCDSPLMYFATPTWNVRVTEIAQRMVQNNQDIKWVPGHVRDGRFGNWLADARDWGISRNRFWGNPLPIWRNVDDGTDIIVVGSVDELCELAGSVPEDLHRPAIDAVVIKKDGRTYRRVEEVLDCWFESGSMPYAQDHYPFTNKDGFEAAFPADFIAEGLDQTRGWFYTLHVLGTALFDKPAFKNVVVNGLVLAADGQKMSKRLKNYPPFDEVFNSFGADTLRYFMMASPAVTGENVRFSREALTEVQRNVFVRLWNVYSFMTTYAEVDGWAPPEELVQPESDNLLDVWLLSRLNQTIAETTAALDRYELNRSVWPITSLLDDLSNWYVRRSRRRFWKSEDDGDKAQAYRTLHYALVRISQLLAPVAPFVSDKLWRGLTAGMALPESVHLSDWPAAELVDDGLLRDMAQTREAITLGLAQRAAAGIKVRQPLGAATLRGAVDAASDYAEQLTAIVREELNVKQVHLATAAESDEIVTLDTTFTPELLAEGLARDVVRAVQVARKAAGLQVDDRIVLRLASDAESVTTAIESWRDMIMAEVLAVSLELGEVGESAQTGKVGGVELRIGVTKAE